MKTFSEEGLCYLVMLNAGNAPMLLPVGNVLVFAVGALNILPGGSVSVLYFQRSALVEFPGS